ncbi:MarR family transcriptional regulator [Cytobacillus sp. S13-E01]|uniref:MarR family winged helix-turn-helix transcriptional regulator n=1 Tax=Cytobacillus sp. S13-E01 TaxID=3031326 RepID=UPI0023D84926|nr:MarR family transcriptional regulator [Cytobacillus sp. S13-E01]MDF0727295.1 MarR family transcriptional regulator [Cytobacillus sp. S13-E01]
MINDHNLFHSIQQLSRQLTKHLNEALGPFGLYSSQWSVLFTLKTNGSLTQKELCDYLSVEAPPMTRTIQRLLKQGFVEQIPGKDKRTKFIKLTDKSLQEYTNWETAVFQMKRELVSRFPKQSQDQLYTLLSEWLLHLQTAATEET